MSETRPPALATAIFGFPPRGVAHWNALGLFYQIPGAFFERARGFQMAAEWAPEISPARAFLGDGNGLDAPAFRDHQGVQKRPRGFDRTAQGHSNEPLHVVGNKKLQLAARRALFLPSKNDAAQPRELGGVVAAGKLDVEHFGVGVDGRVLSRSSGGGKGGRAGGRARVGEAAASGSHGGEGVHEAVTAHVASVDILGGL